MEPNKQFVSLVQQFKNYEESEMKKEGGFPLDIESWISHCGVDKDLLPPPDMSKENFWSEIKARWLGEYNNFRSFADDYKSRNEWNWLFNCHSGFQNAAGKNAAAPDVFDLPAAMQIGIFIEYCLTQPHRFEFTVEGFPATIPEMIKHIKDWIAEEEDDALRDHQEGKYMDDYDYQTL